MAEIVNLSLHRRMRELQRGVDDVAAGRVPFMIRGRTQGKTLTPDQVVEEMENYFNHPGVPVRVGGTEEPWYSLRGRAQDMKAQLPTALVLPFKPRPALP